MSINQSALETAAGPWKLIGARLLAVASRAGFVPSDDFPTSWLLFLSTINSMEESGSLCAPFSSWTQLKQELAPKSPQTLPAFIAELQVSGLAVAMKDSAGNLNADASASPRTVPFVIDEEGSRFYLQRQFAQEMRIAWLLKRLATAPASTITPAALNVLRRASRDGKISEEQKSAVEVALQHQISLICGGPGTGKTRTVAFLLEAALQSGASTIYLAAPTGKAASRVLESVDETRFDLATRPYFVKLTDAPIVQHTLHKWLTLPTSSGARPSRDNCLECDVLVVDEASMMDAQLCERLLTVIDPERTKVIFLGDKNQLAAVGPGSVLADMTSEWSTGGTVLPVAYLTASRRFGPDSPFGRLAHFILDSPLEERTAANFAAFCEGPCQMKWLTASRGMKQLTAWVRKTVGEYALEVKKAAAAGTIAPARLKDLWARASYFRVLCAERGGAQGVNAINDLCEAVMREVLGVAPTAVFYPGRLLIVRVNDDQLGVANGELAMVIPDGAGGWLAYFGDKDEEKKESEGVDRLPVGLLPDAQSAFAITIHQSQGSQFYRVAVVLPSSSGSPLAAQELLYTAVTRVQDQPQRGWAGSLTVFSARDVLEMALKRHAERNGGLPDRLRSVRCDAP